MGSLLLGCSTPDRYGDVVGPGDASAASVDRFGDFATLFNRDEPGFHPAVVGPMIPAPNEPIDMDAVFLAPALGPDGEVVQYYALDINPPTPARAFVVVHGDDTPFDGQLPIVETLPGSDGYSDFVQITNVWVGDDYPANAFRSVDDVRAALDKNIASLRPTDGIQNWALVPRGTTAALSFAGEPVAGHQAWHDGNVVDFLLFEQDLVATSSGAVPQSTVVVMFDNNMDPSEGFRTEANGQTHNVFETLPGDEKYSSLWIHRMGDAENFDAVGDWMTAADNVTAVLAGVLVNCPIVD